MFIIISLSWALGIRFVGCYVAGNGPHKPADALWCAEMCSVSVDEVHTDNTNLQQLGVLYCWKERGNEMAYLGELTKASALSMSRNKVLCHVDTHIQYTPLIPIAHWDSALFRYSCFYLSLMTLASKQWFWPWLCTKTQLKLALWHTGNKHRQLRSTAAVWRSG